MKILSENNYFRLGLKEICRDISNFNDKNDIICIDAKSYMFFILSKKQGIGSADVIFDNILSIHMRTKPEVIKNLLASLDVVNVNNSYFSLKEKSIIKSTINGLSIHSISLMFNCTYKNIYYIQGKVFKKLGFNSKNEFLIVCKNIDRILLGHSGKLIYK